MLKLIKQLLESLLRPLPGILGQKLRYFYYRDQFASCGKRIIIEQGVFLENLGAMHLGHNIWIDKNAILVAGAFHAKGRHYIEKGKKLIKNGELHLGNNVHIAPFSLVQAHGGVSIGSDVTVASGAKIYSLSHHYRNLNNKEDQKHYSFSTMAAIENQFLILGNVVISDFAAVGLNAVVLPGVIIPEGTWVGAGAVVNSSSLLTPYSVYKNKNNEA